MLQAAAVLDPPANQRACCKSTVQITLRNRLLTLFFFCRAKLEALWWRDEMRGEGDALKGLCLFKKRRKPQKKRENELIPSWLVSSCKAAAQRIFLHFSTRKSCSTLSPQPHPPLWRRIKKKVQKMKTACVIAAPNMLRGELDIVSHKNATNTLNGLRVILFSYLHFVIFTAAEGWTSIFRETWGAQVTNCIPLRCRSYSSTRPRSIMNQSTRRGWS